MAQPGRVDVEVAEGPWAKAAAATSLGRPGSYGSARRTTNEDVHVILCSGLGASASAAAPAAPPGVSGGGGGLFDDLPGTVSGPALPPAEEPPADCLVAVFDGHGGAAAARLCAQRLPAELQEQLQASGRDTPEARRAGAEGVFQALDRLLRAKLGPRACGAQGTTCVLALAWHEEGAPGRFRLLLANLGDSRALVLSASGEGGALRLAGETADHKPEAPGETARIEAAGGKVGFSPNEHVDFQRPRVDCRLGCSRALGDFLYKGDAALLPEQQKVSNRPDVYEFECGLGDAVVLACDGTLDVLSSRQIADIVARELQASDDPAAAAAAVVAAALADPRQDDNCTCVVLRT